MSQSPIVSIIIPIYNANHYIGKCIESIISLDFNNWELILVDDGSTDDSLRICKSYSKSDSRIYVIHTENGGASKARNIGLKNAVGKWISFIDADDWIDTDFFKPIVDNVDADIIYFGFKEWKNEILTIKQISKSNLFFNTQSSIDAELRKLFISKNHFFGFTWNKFFKKSIIDKNNLEFDEKLIIKEDEEFILRYCKYIKTLLLCSYTPYNYRILTNSLSHSNLKFKRMSTLALKIDTDLDDYPMPYLKTAILNATYYYHQFGVQESHINNSTELALERWIEFFNKNRLYISHANENYKFFAIPQKRIRHHLLKFAVLSPYYKFFSLSYYKNLLYPLFSCSFRMKSIK